MKTKNYITLIFVITLLYFLPFLIRPSLLSARDNDLGRTYVPLYSFFRDSIVNYRQIPFWRPDQLMGETFIGNPLSALFYPASILFIIFPVGFASVLYFLVHFFLAGTFTFLLARFHKFSKEASFIAATFYAFSTKLLLHLTAGHITMVAAFSYFPLIFLSIRNLRDKISFSWIVVASVSLTLQFITYPTVFYYSSIFIFLYLLYELLKLPKHIKKISLSVSVIFLIFFGLSAIELIPQLEFGPLSTRSTLRIEDVAVPMWSLKRLFLSLVFPYPIFKSLDHEAFLYLGIIPATLSFIGFLYLKHRQKLILVLFLFLTILYIAGLSTPFFKLVYDFLPLLKYTRVTTRVWFIVACLSALLSAYAFDRVKKKRLIFLIVPLFLIENFTIGYKKLFTIPLLSFQDEKIYQFLSSNQGLRRVYCTTYCFNPQLISKYKIQVLHGETPIQQKDFINFLQKAGGYSYSNFAVIFPPYQVWQVENPPTPDAEILGEANVKYIVSTYPVTEDNFQKDVSFGNLLVYSNLLYKNRAYFTDSDEQVDISYSPNIISLNFFPSQNTRKLILADNFYPGWVAKSGQKSLPVSKFHDVFKSIEIPPGASQVSLSFRPKSFAIGKTITSLTILAILIYYYERRNHKKWPKLRF